MSIPVVGEHEVNYMVSMIRQTAAVVNQNNLLGFRHQFRIGCFLESPLACFEASSIASTIGVAFITINIDVKGVGGLLLKNALESSIHANRHIQVNVKCLNCANF